MHGNQWTKRRGETVLDASQCRKQERGGMDPLPGSKHKTCSGALYFLEGTRGSLPARS